MVQVNSQKAKQSVSDQATRAMYAMLNKCKKLMLPIDIQMSLFDSLVLPILTYGSEVWGFENLSIIEKMYLKFLKMSLKVNTSTCTNMVYGELGRYPISIVIKVKMLSFWSRIITGDTNKISYLMYKCMYEMDKQGIQEFKWINEIREILDSVGLSYVWQEQNPRNGSWLKSHVQQTLKDQFVQKWNSEIWSMNKCINYRIFKSDFGIEPYLQMLPDELRIKYTKFRCRNHKLPVEAGVFAGLERSKRVCTICDSQEIGDEFHYIINCNFFSKERKLLIDKYFYTHPSTEKFGKLLQSHDQSKLVKMSKFVKIIMEQFITTS